VDEEPRKRVLIVEDDPDLADTLAELLDARYDVTVAADGEQALARLTSDGFEAMVLDLMLPALSGEGVLEQMRQRKLSVPVLIATARDDGGEVMRESGAAAWLRKPFPIGELFAELARIMGEPKQGSGSSAAGGITGESAGTPADPARRSRKAKSRTSRPRAGRS
jgi:DNA-binding response OmpR family regulator